MHPRPGQQGCSHQQKAGAVVGGGGISSIACIRLPSHLFFTPRLQSGMGAACDFCVRVVRDWSLLTSILGHSSFKPLEERCLTVPRAPT